MLLGAGGGGGMVGNQQGVELRVGKSRGGLTSGANDEQ